MFEMMEQPHERFSTFVYKPANSSVSTEEPSTEVQQGDGATSNQMQHDEAPPRKHRLEHIWSLWYLEHDRNKHWKDMLKEVTHIDNVETFWQLYYTINSPSELKVGCDYSLFKKGIQPMWEDAANSKGGRWLVTVNKNSKAILDRLWLNVMLMMIGENFEHATEICGAVVNIRAKNNKISVWTADGFNAPAILDIGHKIKCLCYANSYSLQYLLHSHTMNHAHSVVKPIYTL